MNRVIVDLNLVKTPLLRWGDPLTNGENIIICITGNPGISDFYIDFAAELYQCTFIPVCVIGQAGHEGTINRTNKYLFNLNDQLKHKLELIENHINKNCNIHLVGHSIGAWMIVELLHKNSRLIDRVSSVNLLFPTIQRMAESRSGKFVNNVLRRVYKLVLFLCTLLYLLPKRVLSYIIHVYLWIKCLPPKLDCAIMKILNPDVLENVLNLAFNEMDTVISLNIEGMQKIKHLTNVVYASYDGWVPAEFVEDLKQFTPHIHLREAQNVDHAFVLKSSEEVACLVAEFINRKTEK